MNRSSAATLEQNYSRVAARLLDSLIDFLSAARREYGDIERLLLLVIIAQRAYSDPSFARQALSPRAGDVPPPRPLATNITSIARAASLPRETVRRKINELAHSGVIARDGSRITLTQRGVVELASARAAFATFAARQHDIVARLVAEAANAPVSSPVAA